MSDDAPADAGCRLDALLAHVRRRFAADESIATPDIDARVLVGGLLALDATAMVLHGDSMVESADCARIDAASERRLGGEPVYRILGKRPFFGLDLALSPATLEPRPDTEILVEALRPVAAGRVAGSGRCRIADIGTGSGAIGLSLVSLVPESTCVGADISAESVQTARANAAKLALSSRFEAVESDWFEKISGKFDIIASNPPYIRTDELGDLQREVRLHDPVLALDGGDDGLRAYRVLAAAASRFLECSGVIGVEHGHDQRAAVKAIFMQAGYSLVSDHDDLAGRPRASIYRRATA